MIYIGSKIKEVLDKTGMTVAEFGRRISSSRENVYDIFKRKSLDTDLLVKISEVLNYNFFKDYLEIQESETVQDLRKQLEDAKKEIAYLKRINELLEDKGKKDV